MSFPNLAQLSQFFLIFRITFPNFMATFQILVYFPNFGRKWTRNRVPRFPLFSNSDCHQSYHNHRRWWLIVIIIIIVSIVFMIAMITIFIIIIIITIIDFIAFIVIYCCTGIQSTWSCTQTMSLRWELIRILVRIIIISHYKHFQLAFFLLALISD